MICHCERSEAISLSAVRLPRTLRLLAMTDALTSYVANHYSRVEKTKTCVDSRFHFLVVFKRHARFNETSRRMLTAMKRFLQLVGEMRNYRLPTAKLALQELAADDELVIVVPEQSLAGEIQQWATSQGFTVAAPKKMLDGLARWQLSVKKAVPVPVEEKPAAQAPAPAAAPAASSAPPPAATSTPPSNPA